jgi:hypothetical protein
MAIPLGYFIQFTRERKLLIRSLVSALLILFSALNLFQTWQINKGILHDSRMTREYYFSVFGKTEVTDEERELLLIDRSTDPKEEFTNEEDYSGRLLELKDFESSDAGNISGNYAFSGNYSVRLDSNILFSPDIEAEFKDLTDTDHAWIKASAMIYPVFDLNENPASFVVSFEYKGKLYKYRSIDLEKINLELNKWNKVSMEYLTPEVRSKRDKLKVYLWLRGKKQIYMDDLKVEVFEKKE